MSSSPRKITELDHVATGGTVDSEWIAERDTARPRSSTVVPEYLRRVRLPFHQLRSTTLCMKDSKEMGIGKQDAVGKAVNESPRNRILATTGTYLLPDIARSVQEHPGRKNFKRLDKKATITGGLVPITRFVMSDGGFNIGMAIAALGRNDIPSGVYAVINGMCLDAKEGIRKDLTEATFSSNSGQDILGYTRFTLVPAGGSTDFTPDGLDGMMPLDESGIPTFLRRDVKIQREFHVISPFLKDSRLITPDNIDTIIEITKSDTSGFVVVNTGIYRMGEIRAAITKALGKPNEDKSVVLTGSRYSLDTHMSDAPFNLGFTLGMIDGLPPGVHIALNGVVLTDKEDPVQLIYTKEERVKLREMGVIE